MENAKNIKAGDAVSGEFLVLESSVRLTKTKKEYVDLTLRAIDGTVFEGCKRWDCAVKPDGVIRVEGHAEEFNGAIQLKLKDWHKGTSDPNDFQAYCPWHLDIGALAESWDEMMNQIFTERIRKFTTEFVAYWSTHRYPSLEECPKRFFEHPGAQRIHHSYRHGLIEHTVEVMQHAHDLVEQHDLSDYELSLLIAGCAIHDIGKLEEFHLVQGVYEFTQHGKAYGWSSNAHLYLGSQMMAVYSALNDNHLSEEEFLVLQNIIMGHHGQFADTRPKYIVTMLAHIADMASSQVNRMRMNLELTPDNEVTRDSTGQSYMAITPIEEDE